MKDKRLSDKELSKMQIHKDLNERDWIDAKNELPKVTGDCAFVYIKHLDYKEKEKIIKGMFYINGKQPVFCAYGSQIDNVIAWQPRK